MPVSSARAGSWLSHLSRAWLNESGNARSRNHLAMLERVEAQHDRAVGWVEHEHSLLERVQLWAAQLVVVVEYGWGGAGREGDSHRVCSIGHQRDQGLR